jgi:hypothetical protein
MTVQTSPIQNLPWNCQRNSLEERLFEQFDPAGDTFAKPFSLSNQLFLRKDSAAGVNVGAEVVHTYRPLLGACGIQASSMSFLYL